MPSAYHPKRFGEKLNQLRSHKKLTLKELANHLGYATHGYLSELECGRKIPTVELVIKVARFFQVSIDDLLLDERDIPRHD